MRLKQKPMKKSLLLLLGVALSSGACTGYVAAPAPGYYGPAAGVVVVEYRPYYVHGPSYYSRGVRYRWVGGHWVHRGNQRVWVHGHYVGRG